jgi:hypothetical protein
VRGRVNAARHQFQGLVVFALGLALSGGSLAALEHIAPDAGREAQLSVLVLANLIATVVRFVALRRVFDGYHARR